MIVPDSDGGPDLSKSGFLPWNFEVGRILTSNHTTTNGTLFEILMGDFGAPTKKKNRIT